MASKMMGAAAAFAAVTALTACAETPQPKQDYSATLQNALSAYYTTHGLDKNTVPAKGLTISWAHSANETGFMVATGTKSGNCPVFDVAAHLVNSSSRTRVGYAQMAVCP